MSFKKLCISQGRYDLMAERYGSLDAVAERFAAADVLALSHSASINHDGDVTPTPCGCVDRGEPLLPELLSKIRALNPDIEIFGYVSGTADAPHGCGYGTREEKQADGTIKVLSNEYAVTGWLPPFGVCNNFMHWGKKWNGFGVTGLIIDLVAPQYMSSAVRDSIYAWCRLKGYKIMPNSTYPAQGNVAFASVGLGVGDYLLVEAFRYGDGNDTLAGTNAAMAEINVRRGQGFKMAAACTMKWSTQVGQTVNPADWPNANAVSMIENFGQDGDAYQYDRADLGIICRTIPSPAI